MEFSSEINKHVVLNNAILAGKNFWINTRVDTFIRTTRVIVSFMNNDFFFQVVVKNLNIQT